MGCNCRTFVKMNKNKKKKSLATQEKEVTNSNESVPEFREFERSPRSSIISREVCGEVNAPGD